MRELVFGKGESSLLENFGAEDAGRGEGEVSQPASASLGRGGEPEPPRQLKSEGQEEPLWIEDFTGDASVLGGDAEGVREGPRPERDGGGGGDGDEEAADGPAWVDEDDARVKVRYKGFAGAPCRLDLRHTTFGAHRNTQTGRGVVGQLAWCLASTKATARPAVS